MTKFRRGHCVRLLIAMCCISPAFGQKDATIVSVDCTKPVGDGKYAHLGRFQHGVPNEEDIFNAFKTWDLAITRAFVIRTGFFIPKEKGVTPDYEALLDNRDHWQVDTIYQHNEKAPSIMIPWNLFSDDLGVGKSFDYDRYEDLSRRLLLAMKKRFDKIEYIEVLNEPTGHDRGPFNGVGKWDKARIAVVVELYTRLAKVVQDVNKKVSNGKKLKIGGPTTIQYWPNFVEGIIKCAAQKKLPLDFIAWHDYSGDKATMESAIKNVATTRALLKKYRLTNCKELLVTEYGGGFAEKDAPKAAMTAEQLSRVAIHIQDVGAGYMKAGVDCLMPWYHQWKDRWSMNMFGYRFIDNMKDGRPKTGWMTYSCAENAVGSELQLSTVVTEKETVAVIDEIEFLDAEGRRIEPVPQEQKTAPAISDKNLTTSWKTDPKVGWNMPRLNVTLPPKSRIAKVRVHWHDAMETRLSISVKTPEGLDRNLFGPLPLYPQGHLMNMHHRLRDTLLDASCANADVRAMPTIGADGISVIVWNRSLDASATTTLALSKIPKAFGDNLRCTSYLTDQTTANYAHNKESWQLIPKELPVTKVTPSRDARVTVTLKPLAICQLVFTPDAKAAQ